MEAEVIMCKFVKIYNYLTTRTAADSDLNLKYYSSASIQLFKVCLKLSTSTTIVCVFCLVPDRNSKSG